MGDSQRFLEITASIQSQGMALSEWADARPEPWATVLRFLPISAAFFLGLFLVLLWKRKTLAVQEAVELEGEPLEPVLQPKSDAEEKLPLVQNELKLSLEKNKRQKERITSAKRALEVKDQELGEKGLELERQDQELAKLRVKILTANEVAVSADEPVQEQPSPPITVEPREDLREFAAASEELAKAAVDFRSNLREGKSGNAVEPERSVDWDELLLFRSSDPSIWNHSVSEGENHSAIVLSEVPDNMAYLRLLRLDTGEGVIMAVQARDLDQDGGDLITGFNGSNEEFYGACHLGIYSEELPQQVEVRFAYGGWGFGHRPDNETTQACAWAGQEINAETVMEITVFPRFPGLTDKDQLIEPS